jgi:hypothetical protein
MIKLTLFLIEYLNDTDTDADAVESAETFTIYLSG